MSNSTYSDTCNGKNPLLISVKGQDISQTMSFRNNVMASTRTMPFTSQRQRYGGSVCDQRSIYYKRDTSPLSLCSESGLRPQSLHPPYYPARMRSQPSIYNRRSRSPMSVRSIDSNMTIAEVVTSAFRNAQQFSDREFMEIQRAYKEYLKKRLRTTMEKKRNRRLIQKAARRRYGGDSEDASESMLSSDDCRSIRSSRTTNYKRSRSQSSKLTRMKITNFRRSLKESNLLQDCTDNFKQTSFLNSLQYDSLMSQRNQWTLQKPQSLSNAPLINARHETDSEEEEMPQTRVIEHRTNNNLRNITAAAHKDLGKVPLRSQRTLERNIRHEHDNEQEEIPDMRIIANRPHIKLPVSNILQKNQVKHHFPLLSQSCRQPQIKGTTDTSQSLCRISERNANNESYSEEEVTNIGVVGKDTNNRVQHTSRISQKDRFTNRGCALLYQRFRPSMASQSITLESQKLQKAVGNTFVPETDIAQDKKSAGSVKQNESHKKLRNACAVSQKDQFGEGNSLSSQKFGHLVNSAKPQTLQKTSEKNARHENGNKENVTKVGNGNYNKPQNPAKNNEQLTDNIFAIPQIPVKKSKTVKNRKINEESLQAGEKIISMSPHPPLEELVSELLNDKENEQHTEVEHSSTTDLSMRPSFIKRKLFSQKVQIPESDNISSDDLQESKETVQKGENRTRKLVTNQSCLNRDVDGEDSTFLDLIYKIVPQDRMNVTTATTKSINNKNKPDNSTMINKTNAVDNADNREDESDTYTDEEIFKESVTYQTFSDQNTQITETAVVAKLQSQNTKQASTIVNKPNKTTGSVKRGLKSFWDSTDESDIEPEPKKRRSFSAVLEEEINRGPAKLNNITNIGQNNKKAADSKKITKNTKPIRKPVAGAEKHKQTEAQARNATVVTQNEQVCKGKNKSSNVKQTKQVNLLNLSQIARSNSLKLQNSSEKIIMKNVVLAQDRPNTKLKKNTGLKVKKNTKSKIETEAEESFKTKSTRQQQTICNASTDHKRKHVNSSSKSNIKPTKTVQVVLEKIPTKQGRIIGKKASSPIEKTTNLIKEKVRHESISSDMMPKPKRTRTQNPLYQSLSNKTREQKRTRARKPLCQNLSDTSIDMTPEPRRTRSQNPLCQNLSDMTPEPRRTRSKKSLYRNLSDMTPEPRRTRSQNPLYQNLSDVSFSLISDKKLPNKKTVEREILPTNSSHSPVFNTRPKRTLRPSTKLTKQCIYY